MLVFRLRHAIAEGAPTVEGKPHGFQKRRLARAVSPADQDDRAPTWNEVK